MNEFPISVMAQKLCDELSMRGYYDIPLDDYKLVLRCIESLMYLVQRADDIAYLASAIVEVFRVHDHPEIEAQPLIEQLEHALSIYRKVRGD